MGPVLASARQVLHRELSIEELGEFLEVSRATAYRREKDGLTEQEADNLACHLLTVHPYCVWPEWFDDIAEIDEEAELADDLATCA